MNKGRAVEAVKVLDKLYEFDREPVSHDRLLGPGYFAGAYSGEHVAATEFVIGVLFVNWGASVRDVFLGLALGNLLAVLTWRWVCAPIAVQTRLTLYWYLRRIGGPVVNVIYNVLNALLFCVLAGCMITVSASAVRILFGIPAQVQWYPTDVRFVFLVLFVGAVVVTLAVLGFKKLSSFSVVCSPWMFLMFIAGAVVMLPKLAQAAGLTSISSLDQFFEMGRRVVWTATTPDGREPMGFWRVAAFAWICNLAMHAGLSDMALLRFARKASYGYLSAFGMFLGHYVAWICAGMLGAGAALLINMPLAQMDSGEVGYQVLGWAGAIAVVLAGWTTANPTLYRAGLAFQAVTPNWSRAKITIVVGAATTIIACFPFVFTRLLDFVGLYGLLLSPVGAIVVAEHWIFPRLGLTRYWASHRGLSLNRAALLSWLAAMIFALVLNRTGVLHLFYLFLPTYLLTLALYTVLAAQFGAKQEYSDTGPVTGAEEAKGQGRRAESREQSTLRSPLSASSSPPASPALLWMTGLVAVTALVACILLSVWVAAASNSATFAANHALFKKWLILPTLIYFVAGTLWFMSWEKRKEQRA